MRILTVRQPWAWAIIHAGKTARLSVFSFCAERIGTCPVNESQDTPSTERPASAAGRLTSARSEASERHMPITLPRLARRTSSPAETADSNAPRAKCLGRSQASAKRVRPLGPARGPRRTLTSGNATVVGHGSSRSTASPQRSTTSAWPLRVASARSAASLPLTLAAIECTLTIATTPAASVGFSAGHATRASVDSATASSGCAPRSTTCSRRSATLIGGALCAS